MILKSNKIPGSPSRSSILRFGTCMSQKIEITLTV
jgi:hypothetical protein